MRRIRFAKVIYVVSSSQWMCCCCCFLVDQVWISAFEEKKLQWQDVCLSAHGQW